MMSEYGNSLTYPPWGDRVKRMKKNKLDDFHISHPAIIKRLKRANGHLHSIVRMIEDSRPCLELAAQLYAVEKAICQAKKTLIQDHLDHCLEKAARPLGRDEKHSIDEFKEITKYL